MKSPGRFAVMMLFSFAVALMLRGVDTTAGFSQADQSQDDPCLKEKAELAKINNQIAITERQLYLRELEMRAVLNESIEVDKKIAARGPEMSQATLDSLKQKSADLRNRTTRLKSEIAQRKEDLRPFEERARLLKERIEQGCPPVGDDWQKAIGKWGSKDNKVQFEIQDLNKADREYYRNTPVKIEGYIVKQGGWSPTKVKSGDILFISNKVGGNTLSGKWLNAPQGTDCPRLSVELSNCTIRIDPTSDTLTVEHDAMLYSYPDCKWSKETRRKTATYYRIK
ncbi:MAG: hypothetical protein AB1631_00860 [Acidobacteriota bacterium]